MKNLSFTLICACLSLLSYGQNTNISGTINDYTSVTSISGTTITVASSASFSLGDLVLIIQMQGATIDESNSSSFGNITSIGDAGNYEYASVCGIPNGTQVVVNNLQRTYTPSGAVQLIRVPVYDDATITATLTAAPWDGTIGGVLAFECTGTLTMNNSIDLQGAGFRGGSLATSAWNCSFTNNTTAYFYDAAGGEGAKKGEGVALFVPGKEYGKGAQASGGGGSNDHNGGGGGGGNAGAGGLGGERIPNSPFTCKCTNPGIGGNANTYSNAVNKIFLGGGGGSGHENNAGLGTAGSNGGGIVIIKANAINGNGQTINVTGGTTPIPSFDGGGGGGAGGTVLLDVSTYTGSLNVNADGITGGSVHGSGSSNCNGPGGGGSGGILWVNSATIPGNITYSTVGGLSGTTLSAMQTNCVIGGTNGALPGANGSSLTTLAIPNNNCNVQSSAAVTICGSDSLFVGGAWQTTAGIYTDTITSACCDSIIETTLSVASVLSSTLNETICDGESIVVNGTTYSTSVTGATETFTNVGTSGCDSIVTINLTVLSPLSSTMNETICAGESLVLNGTTYSSSVSGATEVFSNVGPNGCDSTVTLNLTVLAPLTGTINDTICEGESIVVNGTTYSTTVVGATEVFTNIGPNSCDSTVTINLTVDPLDNSVTNTDPTLTANAVGAVYQWVVCPGMLELTGETNQSFTAVNNGDYAVIVTNNGCTDTSACITITGLEIIENDFGDGVMVYPNPTDGNFSIDLGAEYSSVTVTISDVSGRLVLSNTYSNSQLVELKLNEPAGVYNLVIQSEDKKAVIRLVKE